MVWRFLHVSRYYNQMDGLLRAQFAYPDVEMCVISPDQAINDGMFPLVSNFFAISNLNVLLQNFDTADIDSMV